MSQVKFSLEKKGYAKEQVNTYVQLIQENYQKLSQEVAEIETEIEIMSDAAKREQEEQRITQITYKRMDVELDNIQTTLDQKIESNQYALVQYEELKTQMAESQKRADELTLEIEVLECNKSVSEDTDLCNYKKQLLTDIDKEAQTKAELQQEKLNLQQMIGDLSARKEALEEKIKDITSAVVEEHQEAFQEMVNQAKQHAEDYAQTVKQQVQKDRKNELAKAKQIFEDIKKEAEEIILTAGEREPDDIDAELDQIEAERITLKKSREEFLANCEYIKREAEVESKSIREEADHIVRRAEEKLELAREKDKTVTDKTTDKIKRLGENMISEYRYLQQAMGDVIDEMQTLFRVPEQD